MFIPFPYYSASSNCKTIILNGIGYRNETYCGSGVRNLSEIVEYERFELGNTDIDYFCSKYGLSNNTRYWYDDIISGCRLNVLDIVGFVSKIMSIPEERLGNLTIASIVTVLALIAITTILVVCLNVYGDFAWSGYAVFGILLFYIIFNFRRLFWTN